jgi:hypothetical protein
MIKSKILESLDRQLTQYETWPSAFSTLADFTMLTLSIASDQFFLMANHATSAALFDRHPPQFSTGVHSLIGFFKQGSCEKALRSLD